MQAEVQHYINSCDLCGLTKTFCVKSFNTLVTLETQTTPCVVITLDFLVELHDSDGHTVVLTIVDQLINMADFLPCNSLPSAEKMIQLLVVHVIYLHRLPDCINLDRGPQFVSHFWHEALRLMDIHHPPDR